MGIIRNRNHALFHILKKIPTVIYAEAIMNTTGRFKRKPLFVFVPTAIHIW